MIRLKFFVLAVLLLNCFTGVSMSMDTRSQLTGEHITVELISAFDTVKAGQSFWVAVHFKPEQDWHTYWRNPGDSGSAPTVQWQTSNGVDISGPFWPIPDMIPVGHLNNIGYKDASLLLFKINTHRDIKDSILMKAALSWLVCEEACIPGEGHLSINIKVDDRAKPSHHHPLIQSQREQLPRKDHHITTIAHLNDGGIELIASGLPSAFVGSRFFPYEEDFLDYTSKGTWHKAKDQGAYKLSLALNTMGSAKPGRLEGILVSTDGQAVEIGSAFTPADPASATHDINGQADISFWLAVFYAFIGGLILNIMPCVLPILALKALSISKMDQRSGTLQYGLYYLAGVIACFIVIALLLALVRTAGNAAGWGFQLQEPLFIAGLTLVFFLMSLALLGYYSPGARLMGLGQNTFQNNDSNRNAFYGGLLAVIVASPCTAPLMAPALGYALSVPLPNALIIHLALATGFALPLFTIALFPALRHWIPKPGAWMNTFKEAMAFPMLLTVVWLISVLNGLTGAPGVYLMLIVLVVAGFGIWLSASVQGQRLRTILLTVSLSSILYLISLIHLQSSAPSQPDFEQAYSAKALANARQNGDIVLVNFTADWCITCKINEHTVLKTEGITELLRRDGMTYLVADWTQKNPAIAKELEKHGRSGVPLYLLYDGLNKPLILPQILTRSIVTDAIQQIQNTKF